MGCGRTTQRTCRVRTSERQGQNPGELQLLRDRREKRILHRRLRSDRTKKEKCHRNQEAQTLSRELAQMLHYVTITEPLVPFLEEGQSRESQVSDVNSERHNSTEDGESPLIKEAWLRREARG